MALEGKNERLIKEDARKVFTSAPINKLLLEFLDALIKILNLFSPLICNIRDVGSDARINPTTTKAPN